MSEPTITFIGGGNMAAALIGGLRHAGIPAGSVRAADPDSDQRRRLADEFAVATEADNPTAARGADVIVLAVKPQVMDAVLEGLAPSLESEQLVVSIAAGIPLKQLSDGLDGHRRVVRAMPNTPALYGAGITGLVAADGVSDADRQRAEQVLTGAGDTVWVDDEPLMDAVTAVSGSGPAYFFALTEHLARAGEQAGLDAETAARLARRTAIGAGVMLAESDASPTELRRRVTSPGGTTAAALDSLGSDRFAEIIERAVNAAVTRGRELGKS